MRHIFLILIAHIQTYPNAKFYLIVNDEWENNIVTTLKFNAISCKIAVEIVVGNAY
jgi:hypothetical protein